MGSKKLSGEQLELFKEIGDFRKVYNIADDLLVEFSWADRRLRELLWRRFIFSECGKIRAKMPTEKMSDKQRSDSARHASRARWMKEHGWDMWPGIKVIDRSSHDGNGSGNGNGAVNGGAL